MPENPKLSLITKHYLCQPILRMDWGPCQNGSWGVCSTLFDKFKY